MGKVRGFDPPPPAARGDYRGNRHKLSSPQAQDLPGKQVGKSASLIWHMPLRRDTSHWRGGQRGRSLAPIPAHLPISGLSLLGNVSKGPCCRCGGSWLESEIQRHIRGLIAANPKRYCSLRPALPRQLFEITGKVRGFEPPPRQSILSRGRNIAKCIAYDNP